MSKYEIREEMLDALREQLRPTMSEKRYRHTVEVERMAARLGALYAPAQIMILRAAALLHDVAEDTEYTLEQSCLLNYKYCYYCTT
jgi:HD superfamily phosphohydrolase YqeK